MVGAGNELQGTFIIYYIEILLMNFIQFLD